MSSPETRQRAIRLWLYAMAALIFAMVLVGGATRLTESGLSIVEWKPVTGTLPPIGEGAWQAEFDKYKTIPQFQHRNSAMTLAEFKTIFWWEWAHRLLGRLIGAAFLLPFLWFLAKGWVGPGLRGKLWTIFGLGALQGGIGWWMVASGLTERVEVSQYRLATHLILACVIFAAILWTATGMQARARIEVPKRIHAGAMALLVLVLIQIYLGALVAGRGAPVVRVPSIDVDPVDSTGAGDTFCGVLAARLADGVEVVAAVRAAVVAGALAVTRQGAQSGVPTAAEVLAALGRLA